MIYAFDQFRLDLQRGELRRNDAELSLEPRAFALLCLLIENHDRLVSKDEVLEKVWDGRIVSDTAISTVIKSTRKVLGDDGSTQRFIRTVRGRGYRFAAVVRLVGAEPNPLVPSELPHSPEAVQPRPSLAILPFSLVGYAGELSAIADAIPAELISSLSRLRWIQVIARGSSFRFRDQDPNLDVIRETLGANYCLTGIVEIFSNALTIAVELSDT
ncbi:MAG: winged helix-turn-helix domain-containing protein, partial [Pseudomonadales bacterium]